MVSNPKYRTPIPENKLARPKEEGLPKILEAAIDLGQEIEKHKQKKHKPDIHILSPKLAKENPELIAEFDKLATTNKPDSIYTADPEWRDQRLKREAEQEIYWNRNIFTKAIAKFGRWIKW